MFDKKFYRRRGNVLEIFLIGLNRWHTSTHSVGYLLNIHKLEDPDALVSENSALKSQTPEQSAEAALPDLTHEQQKKEGAMHEIKDLSDLIDLLSAKPAGPVTITLSPEIQEGLQGCLELGLKQVVSFNPTMLNPRMVFALSDRRDRVPKMRVKPKDFTRYCSVDYNAIPGNVIVDKDLLTQGVGWLFDGMEGPRLREILEPLEAKIEACTEETIEASRAHVQEIADWLDNIMDNRPNRLANELRESVKSLNAEELLAKLSHYGDYL
jgi:hypothetical protein